MKLLRILKREDGIALLMALGMLLTLTVAGTTVIVYTSSNSRSSEHSEALTNAYSLAEAGIAEAISKLAGGTNPTDSTLLTSVPPVTLGGGTVTYSGVLAGTTWTITSTGKIPNPSGPGTAEAKRTLTRKINIAGLDVGSLSGDWDRIHQESTGTCFTVPVDIPSRVTAKGDLCLSGAHITGSTTRVAVGGNVTLTGSSLSVVKSAVAGTGWTSSNNVGATDNLKASTVLAGLSTSPALDTSNFGFALPSDATITGISARVERAASAASTVEDADVFLLKNGAPAGTDKAAVGTKWGTGDAYAAYGTSTDAWGSTWTAADVNASNFGLRLAATNNVASAANSVKSAGTGTGWTNPANIVSQNNIYATTSLAAGITSGTLDATNFGFALPSDAVITGISARIERKASVGSTAQDLQVYVLKNGAPVGSNKAATGTYWGTSDAYRTYGAAGDLWGTTLTVADVNSANFGFRLVAKNLHASTTATASVDHMEITVYYNTGATVTAYVDHVEITVYYNTTNGSIGYSGSPILGADVFGTCKLGAAAANTPCSSVDNVFASTITATNTVNPRPTVDFDFWWANAKPGPKYPCNYTNGTTPPLFDSNAATTSAPDLSLTGIEITPEARDYTCQYRDPQGNILGELSWTRATRVLTIKGTVYIDGDPEFHDHITTPVHYQGRGTIWGSGKWHNDEAICAGGSGAGSNCRTTGMSDWDPEQNLLIIIVGGKQLTIDNDVTFHQDYSAFQGIIYAKNTCTLGDNLYSSGPIICNLVTIQTGNTMPQFFPWPTLPVAVNGQVYKSGTKFDRQLMLGQQTD